jgi:hypothetical protein
VFKLLRNSPSWEAFVSEVHGPSSSKRTWNPIQLESSWRPHQHGSHASSRTRLDLELLDERMAACHRSATEHRDFIREETDFVESGFYAVLPYSAVRHLPGLRFPLGDGRSETGVPGW